MRIARALLNLLFTAWSLGSPDPQLVDPNSDYGWLIDPNG
jgi:hypothetical protein